MAAKTGEAIKGGDIFRALIDLVILALLVCGSAFGGYWYGVHERLAPVQNVPPGTPGAVSSTDVTPAATGTATMPTPAAQTTPLTIPSAPATPQTSTTPAATTHHGTKKYWLASSGVDYMGYSVTVSVNDNPVDSFYGPGKTFDITRFVKPGENTVQFEAKPLGDQYNKHKDDGKSELKVQVVAGPKITDEFKSSDVVLSYVRRANESEEFNDSLKFTAGK